MQRAGLSHLASLESSLRPPGKMARSVPKKQGRRRLSKSSQPEGFSEEKENIDPRSKEQQRTPPVSVPIPQIKVTPASKVLGIDGCSIAPTDNSLYFITFTRCKHQGFHILSKNPTQDKFSSSLKFFSPSTPTSVQVPEMYIFDKPCPECNPIASVPLENIRESILAFSNMPLQHPEGSFLASLEKSEKWAVSWPVVQPMVPDPIRRFGKFNFEDDQDQAQGKHERKADGSDRPPCLRSYKTTALMPIYVEDFRTPAPGLTTPGEDLGTPPNDLGEPAEDLGLPAKKSKVRRRWRKVRMISRTAVLPRKAPVK